jgi:hypothetical protein
MPTPDQMTALTRHIQGAAERKAASLIAHHLDELSVFLNDARRQGYGTEFAQASDLMAALRGELTRVLATYYRHEVTEVLVNDALTRLPKKGTQPELWHPPALEPEHAGESS